MTTLLAVGAAWFALSIVVGLIAGRVMSQVSGMYPIHVLPEIRNDNSVGGDQ